jgi:hypothetical protein
MEKFAIVYTVVSAVIIFYVTYVLMVGFVGPIIRTVSAVTH